MRLVGGGECNVGLHERVAAITLRRHEEKLGRVRAAVEIRLHILERFLDRAGLGQAGEKLGRHVAQVNRDAVLGKQGAAGGQDARAGDLAGFHARPQRDRVREFRGCIHDGRKAVAVQHRRHRRGELGRGPLFRAREFRLDEMHVAVLEARDHDAAVAGAERTAPRASMSFAGPAAAILPSTIRIAASSTAGASGAV